MKNFRLVRYNLLREMKAPYFLPSIILIIVIGILIGVFPSSYMLERYSIVGETDRTKAINNLEKIISEGERKLADLKATEILAKEEISLLENSDWHYIDSYKSHLRQIKDFTDEEYFYRVAAIIPISELSNALYGNFDHLSSIDQIKKKIDEGLASENESIRDMAINIKNKQVSMIPLGSNSKMLKTSKIMNQLLLPLFSALTAVSVMRRKAPRGTTKSKVYLAKIVSSLLLIVASIILIKTIMYFVFSALYPNDGIRLVSYSGSSAGIGTEPDNMYKSMSYFKLMLSVQGMDLLYSVFIALFSVIIYLLSNSILISILFPTAMSSISLASLITAQSNRMGILQIFQYPIWSQQFSFATVNSYYSGFGVKRLENFAWSRQSIYMTLTQAVILSLLVIFILLIYRKSKSNLKISDSV
ncbi:MAG: hypothetical protein QMB63_07980 [Clostridiaceae bacterium]